MIAFYGQGGINSVVLYPTGCEEEEITNGPNLKGCEVYPNGYEEEVTEYAVHFIGISAGSVVGCLIEYSFSFISYVPRTAAAIMSILTILISKKNPTMK